MTWMDDAVEPRGDLREKQKLAKRLYGLLERHFLNRKDVLAHKPRWNGAACPLEPGEKFRTVLASHLLGKDCPKVTAQWVSKLRGTSGEAKGPFRLGSYSPALDGTTLYATADMDGGGHSHPLADPLGASLTAMAVLRKAGLSPYLEQSKSGDGWHVWCFFTVPVPAALVRNVMLALLPRDLPLRDGGHASAHTNSGMELFPKQGSIERTQAKVGNPIWLPWWYGATWPNNQFHRETTTGVEPYLPDGFETTTLETLQQLEGELCPPPRAQAKQRAPRAARAMPPEEPQDDQGDTAEHCWGAEALVCWALKKADTHSRHQAGLDLACQLRDDKHSFTEAVRIVRAYAQRVPAKDHPYTEDEALATLTSIWGTPARDRPRSNRRGNLPHADSASLSQIFCSKKEEKTEQNKWDKEAESPHEAESPGGDYPNVPNPDSLVTLKPVPASCCRRNPASLLFHKENFGLRKSQRLACNCWSCTICTRRKSFYFALHIVRKLADAVRKRWSLATAEVQPAAKGCIRKAINRACDGKVKAQYARVDWACDRCGYVVAIPPSVAIPQGFVPSTLEAAAALVNTWLGSLEAKPRGDGTRWRPVTLSRGWSMAAKGKPKKQEGESAGQGVASESEKGQWGRVGSMRVRDPGPVLALLAGAGIQPTRREESAPLDGGLTIWVIEWRYPSDLAPWQIEGLERRIREAVDPRQPGEDEGTIDDLETPFAAPCPGPSQATPPSQPAIGPIVTEERSDCELTNQFAAMVLGAAFGHTNPDAASPQEPDQPTDWEEFVL